MELTKSQTEALISVAAGHVFLENGCKIHGVSWADMNELMDAGLAEWRGTYCLRRWAGLTPKGEEMLCRVSLYDLYPLHNA